MYQYSLKMCITALPVSLHVSSFIQLWWTALAMIFVSGAMNGSSSAEVSLAAFPGIGSVMERQIALMAQMKKTALVVCVCVCWGWEGEGICVYQPNKCFVS